MTFSRFLLFQWPCSTVKKQYFPNGILHNHRYHLTVFTVCDGRNDDLPLLWDMNQRLSANGIASPRTLVA